MIDSDGKMYLTVDPLIKINNLITVSKNNALRKIKPYGFNKMYLDKYLTEDRLYQIIYQFNDRKITLVKFYSIILNEMHQFYDGNASRVRYCLLIMIKETNYI